MCVCMEVGWLIPVNNFCVHVCMEVRDIFLILHVWIPHIADTYFLVSPELFPLVKLRPFDKEKDEVL